ncbi:hypothetical protein [Turicibacter sp. TJ11]|uniref:hypothetical protein n=1 Tax=Turicibacter sp. TJ11 TaxID=2806443 RepID=UPI001F22A4F6|nr:hypothetical protein [Turicibacter sp. TJ11]
MLMSHDNWALNAFEFDVRYYYPTTTDTPYAGMLVYRQSEYEFLFAVLMESPKPTPPQTTLFCEKEPGFIWECPEHLKNSFDAYEISLEQVVRDWKIFKTLTGTMPSNFKPLDYALLQQDFPLQVLIMKPVEDKLYPEQTRLKSIDLLTSIFFKDTYGGIWCLTRTNISTIFLIQMKYSPTTHTISPHSDIFMFTELALNLFPSFSNVEDWGNLTLSQLLQVTNLLIHTSSHEESVISQIIYTTLSSDKVQKWLNPNNRYYFNIV